MIQGLTLGSARICKLHDHELKLRSLFEAFSGYRERDVYLRASSSDPGWPGWPSYRDQFRLVFIFSLACSRLRDSRVHEIEKARTPDYALIFSRAFYLVIRVISTIWEPGTCYSQTCIKRLPLGNDLLTAWQVDLLIQVWHTYISKGYSRKWRSD